MRRPKTSVATTQHKRPHPLRPKSHPLDQLVKELALDRTHADVLAVLARVRVVKRGAAVEAVGADSVERRVPSALRLPEEHPEVRGAVHHGSVHDLAGGSIVQ